MVSWTRKRERDAYENLLSKNKFQSLKFSNYLLIDAYPTGTISCVSDSYDIYNACRNIWGEALRDKVMARDGTLVIRSDSGKNIENFFKRNFIIDLF
jgi:nicotinamide phosphoribosyltransferase